MASSKVVEVCAAALCSPGRGVTKGVLSAARAIGTKLTAQASGQPNAREACAIVDKAIAQLATIIAVLEHRELNGLSCVDA